MHILEHYDIKPFNTFGISAMARYFAEVRSQADIAELFSSDIFKNNKRLFLGGGSNVLFTGDFAGLVILNKLSGIDIIEDHGDDVLVRAMGGEVWHDLVTFAVTRGWWGIENLSLIPGTVAAAPMQNIGAYGVELKNALATVEVYDLATREKKIFKNEECKFGYRDSVFKNICKDKYFISAITLRLKKNSAADLSYKILAEYVREHDINANDPKNISEAVADIRRSKLPDSKVIGNAGSFFKNIFVTPEEGKKLQALYPEIPLFEEDLADGGAGGTTKIPAAWLIEHCGWKGYRRGAVGVHEKQALVLVNYGGGTGADIKKLADDIIESVSEKFGLTLETEVTIV